MSEPMKLAELAAELRREFDESFARAHAPPAPTQLDILLIGVAERSYALRLRDVAELFADREPVPVPSSRSDLLGLIGIRGVVTPVYDLALQLGHARAERPRWLVRARAGAPFAVAFERFERHLRLPASSLVPAAAAEARSAVRASVRMEPQPVPLIELTTLFDVVTKRRTSPERAEEHR